MDALAVKPSPAPFAYPPGRLEAGQSNSVFSLKYCRSNSPPRTLIYLKGRKSELRFVGVKCLPSLCNVIRRRGVVSKKGGRGGEREEKEICSILNIISSRFYSSCSRNGVLEFGWTRGK